MYGKQLLEVARQKGLTNEVAYQLRDQWSVRRLLRQMKVDPAKLTEADVSEANRIERQERAMRHARMAEENRRPNVKLPWVVVGDPELDPLLNPDHPVNRNAGNPPAKTRRGASMSVFKISQKQAVRLLEQLGYQNAKTMSPAALHTAISKLDETADDAAQAKVTDEASQEVLRKLLVALTAGNDVTLTTEGNAGTKKPDTKTPTPASDDEGEDDDEDGDEDEFDDDGDDDDEAPVSEPAKKPAKKPQMTHVPAPKPAKAPAKPAKATAAKKPAPAPAKPAKASSAKPGAATKESKKPEGNVGSARSGSSAPSAKTSSATAAKAGRAQERTNPKKKPGPKATKGPKMPRNGKGGRPGVYAVIVEVLQKASKTKPVTEDGILKVLTQKIKDKKPEGMMTTLKDALRRTLNARYKLDPQHNNKGGWWLA